MNLTMAILVAAGFVLAWILASRFLSRKSALPVKVLLLVVFAGSVLLPFARFVNPAFRIAFDSRWNPVKEHAARGTGGTLPLPPETALRYRFSDDGAVYYTRRPAAQVREFYERLGENAQRPQEPAVGSQGMELAVTYRGESFVLQITSPLSGQGSDLKVEGR